MSAWLRATCAGTTLLFALMAGCSFDATGSAGGPGASGDAADGRDSPELPDLPAVQSGFLHSTGSGTETVEIQPVDPARAFLLFGTRHDSLRPSDSFLRGRIASGTELEFVRVTDRESDIFARWYVVEYPAGISVQHGDEIHGSATMEVEIDPVTSSSQAFVTFSKTAGEYANNFDHNDPMIARLTAPDRLQLRVTTSSSHPVSWQVISFDDPEAIDVQAGTTALYGEPLSETITLEREVEPDRAFVLASFNVTSSGPGGGRRMARAEIVDGNTIRIERGETGTTGDLIEIAWQVVELKDGSRVQSGVAELGPGERSRTVSVAGLDPARTAAFGSVQWGGGQNMGSTAHTDTNVVGVGCVTMEVTQDGLLLERESDVAAAEIAWFAVEFGPRP
jgi:hypothetical protein